MSRDVAGVLRDFVRLLSDDRSVDDVLKALGNYCTEMLGVDGVGVLLRDEKGDLQVATANTEVGRTVETLEAELREGPCTSSMMTGLQVAEPDLNRALERYPSFARRALAAGVTSVHGLPLTVRVEQIGALNIIASTPKELTQPQLADAQLLGDVAMSYIANRRALDRSTELARQLQYALDSRVVIEQAKGVLAERHGVSVSEAFERLRSHARSTRTKVHDTAAAVLAGELDL